MDEEKKKNYNVIDNFFVIIIKHKNSCIPTKDYGFYTQLFAFINILYICIYICTNKYIENAMQKNQTHGWRDAFGTSTVSKRHPARV